MRESDWKIIVVLHKTRNITKASEALFMSQPSLSKRIQSIEDDLGVPLLVRSRRGCEFTPEGEFIAERAESITMAMDNVRKELLSRNRGFKGILRIGVPYSYVRYVLPALLAHYQKQYPDIEVNIMSAFSDELIPRVEDGTLDLCFARITPGASTLERLLICEDQTQAVYTSPFSLDELPKLPFIDYAKNPYTASSIHKWWNERYPMPPKTRFKVSNPDVAVSMVSQGLGFSIFPDTKYIRNEKNLHCVPLEFLNGTPFTRKTWLLYKKYDHTNFLVNNFVRFMEQTDIDALTKNV